MTKLLEQEKNDTNPYSKELFEKWFGIRERRKHKKLEAAKEKMLAKLREKREMEAES